MTVKQCLNTPNSQTSTYHHKKKEGGQWPFEKFPKIYLFSGRRASLISYLLSGNGQVILTIQQLTQRLNQDQRCNRNSTAHPASSAQVSWHINTYINKKRPSQMEIYHRDHRIIVVHRARWKVLAKLVLCWTLLVSLGLCWSILVSLGQTWSVLVNHGQSWSVLVRLGQS